MAVKLRSLQGKVPYDVEQQIRDLVFAVNQLEQRLAKAEQTLIAPVSVVPGPTGPVGPTGPAGMTGPSGP